MLFLIIITLIAGSFVYYIWNLDFEEGDGFTEEKKKIKEVEYHIVEKDNIKKIEGSQ